MRPAADSQRARWLAFVVVTAVGLWLLWPVPLGHAPLSKDHTVHLTRIWAWSQVLATGAPRGWSEVWFFGTPIGEVYPVLGDMLVVAIRVLGLGLLDWHQAYAIGFTVVFVSQGWAMLRVGRACGLGELPGVVAALLLLCDVGAYREGGWIYTVDYGVWPQTLANTLTWLGMGELVRALAAIDARGRARGIVLAALAFAGGLLAHPITLPMLALCGLPIVLVLGLRPRARFGDTVWTVALALALALALAAWWVLPMAGMRGWMVSYGWLWQPLEWMIAQGLRGHLDQGMPMGTSVLVVLGIIVVAVAGTAPARLMACCGVLLWVWTAEDSLWRLRLDLFDGAFSQMQWQRFLIAAKPGLLLAAGCGLGVLLHHARAHWRRARRPIAAVLAVFVVGALGWSTRDQIGAMRRAHVGDVQIERDPEDPGLAADYAALAEHVRALAQADSGGAWRIAVDAPRNQHWFMDLPVLTGVGLYKQGFTPGDNFVHKPEAGTPALLDRLGIRYVVTRRRAIVREAEVVATFGQLQLWERRGWQAEPSARLDGAGRLEIVRDDPQAGTVVLRVEGAEPESRLVFDIAGYPRWSLTRDGAPVEWVETPAIGDGPDASTAERTRGELRGGKANGDDGSEPTLLAAPASDGEWTLQYRVWLARDVIATMLSLLAAIACVLLWGDRGGSAARLDRLRVRVTPRLRPWLLAVLAIAAGGLYLTRVRSGLALERERAVGWLDADSRARAEHLHAGPLKTDMLVYPAVVLDRRRAGPAVLELPSVALGERLTGWLALDDDAAKAQREGKHHMIIEARPHGDAGEWVRLFDDPIAHRPGRRWLALPTGTLAGREVDLRITITSEGKSPPELGFDLELGAPPP